MKLQLSITLCVYLLHCSFAELANVPDEFCDEGPPGKYCLPDLTGWHNCYIDQKTGKMVDKVTSCSPNTRCVCFNGPPCPDSIKDPCQPFRLPPSPPDKYTLYYNSKQTVYSPAGKTTTYISGRELQSLTDHKKRDDVYGPRYASSTFVLPRNGGGFNQTVVRMDTEQCVTQEVKTFPESQVPPYFSFNGTVQVGYLLCEKWIWRTGGHNPGQPTYFAAYYISNQTNVASDHDEDPFVPVRIESYYNSGPVGKTSTQKVLNVTSFDRSVEEELFELPSFC